MTIHILPDISRNKGNQTMKIGHILEHNMRNNCIRPENGPLTDDPLECLKKIQTIRILTRIGLRTV